MPEQYPWMPEFYCDDVYWLVTSGSLVRGLFALERDARQLFDSMDPAKEDDGVYLWRLNGGHLCRPHVEMKEPPEFNADAALPTTKSHRPAGGT